MTGVKLSKIAFLFLILAHCACPSPDIGYATVKFFSHQTSHSKLQDYRTTSLYIMYHSQRSSIVQQSYAPNAVTSLCTRAGIFSIH